MSEYDPEGAKIAQKRVEEEFAAAANVDTHTLRRAYNRVVWDGNFSPVSDLEWDDAENLIGDDAPMPMYRAREILRAALQHEPEVEYTHPDVTYSCGGVDECRHPDHKEYGDGGPMCHEEPITIEPHEIKKAYFRELITIYGHLNI